MRRSISFSLEALALALLAPLGCDSGRKAAPDFTLRDVEGNEVSLSSFRGKAVLLNFWGIG